MTTTRPVPLGAAKPSVPRNGWRGAWAGVLALAVSACAGEEARPAPVHTLFDVLSQSSIVGYPATNLPQDVLELASGPFRLRSREFKTVEWISAGLVPERFRKALGPGSGVQHWRLQLDVEPVSGTGPPRVFVDGEPIDAWQPGDGEFPGFTVWYEEAERALYALSAEQYPPRVRIEHWADPQREFARTEKLLVEGGQGPSLVSLIQREELDQVSRPCLLLPAGGTAELQFEEFPAGALRVAVGVVERSYRRVESSEGAALERSSGGSDGAQFVVEVVVEGEAHVVWKQDFAANHVGIGFQKATIDLSAHRGQALQLRLRTLPGEAGDSSFDYGVWSDLSLLDRPQEPDPRPHVVLIDVDTLRADRLGIYGHPGGTSPRIDAWAREHATVYLDAKAPASWTLPSTASMLTGLAPHQHQLLDHDRSLAREVPSLATLLRDAGYETYSDVEGPFFNSGFGMDVGFDEHFNRGETEEARVGARWKRQLERLRNRRDSRPVFLFLQTYLVHAPYRADDRLEDPEDPYDGPLAGRDVGNADVIDPFLNGELELTAADRAYVERLYDAGVMRMDDVVGEFLEELELALDGDPALVILTSDHGEEFFEHGGLGHGHTLFDELLQVPLVVRYPASSGQAATSSKQAASTLDIVPTVLDVVGLPSDARMPGRSLRAAAGRSSLRVAMERDRLEAVELDGTKLILGHKGSADPLFPPLSLFDLERDPGEQENLAVGAERESERLGKLLEAYLREHEVVAPLGGARSEFGSADAAKLRSLGYLGGD